MNMVAPEADGWIGILPCGVKKWVLCAGLRQERGDHCPHLSSLHTVECGSPVAALFVELEGLCRAGGLCAT